jgi:hypothetical protein
VDSEGGGAVSWPSWVGRTSIAESVSGCTGRGTPGKARLRRASVSSPAGMRQARSLGLHFLPGILRMSSTPAASKRGKRTR